MILNPEKTALLLIDMQNDFLHPDGAYGQGGQSSPLMDPLPAKLKGVASAIRSAGGWVVSSHFTILTGKGGEPFIAPHLKSIRPFLGRGHFESGAWGHDVIEALKPVDMKVEKVAYSAFHQSRLQYALEKAEVDTLVIGGIVTNGGVASTVRAAHVLGYHTLVLDDGCAAFSQQAHDAAIASLSTISPVMSSGALIELIQTQSN